MFEASTQVLWFDYFRIPYRVTLEGDGLRNRIQRAGGTEGGPRLLWPVGDALEGTEPAEFRLSGCTLFARLLDDASTSALLPDGGGRWERVAADDDAALWRNRDGDCVLPFDPAEAITACWTESYEQVRSSSTLRSTVGMARKAYYRLRPLLPRSMQIALRRAVSRAQGSRTFPAWPEETSLHDFYDFLLELAADVAGEEVPYIAPWPDRREWALVLTHDVETASGYEHVSILRNVEVETGFRSSWNFVPKRYEVDGSFLRALRADGFEIGVHGLYHDGLDLESEARLRERVPSMREYADRWGAVGFRSPATHRHWDLMPLLPFDYDSSYPDTDPYEPVSGGCCSWLPFHIGDLVELPITLPQDHTLFVILGKADESIWVEKTRRLRKRGGMALLITHPDYMIDEDRVAAYERFLRTFASDETVWKVLPREVSTWWRRRAASSIEPADRGWRIVGPAAEDGRIVMTSGDRAQAASR